MSLTGAELAACSLAAYAGEPYACNWCGKLLQGRQERWCSEAHVDAYLENHDFGRARVAAMWRDRWCCVRCGAAMFGEPTEERFVGQYQGEYWTRGGKVSRRSLLQLEVNHRVPVRGNRAMSCAHHLDNLESLCRPCHVVETRLQILSVRSCENPHRTIACWEGHHARCWSTWAPGTVGPTPGGWVVAGCTCPCHGFTEPGLTLLDGGEIR